MTAGQDIPNISAHLTGAGGGICAAAGGSGRDSDVQRRATHAQIQQEKVGS